MMRYLIRSLLKYKLYSFLNLVGLAFGMCAAITIFLYVQDEFEYDRYHEKTGNVYRVAVTNRFSGNETRWPTTCAPLADAIRHDLTSVQAVARIYSRQATLQIDDRKFREEGAWMADPDVFRILSIPFVAGVAMHRPDQVVLSRSTAAKYFKDPTRAIGADILFEGRLPLTVCGVYEDFPNQSSFRAPLILHFENFYTLENEEVQRYLRSDWIYNPLQTLVALRPNTPATSFERELASLRDKYADERVRQGSSYWLQPLGDIHLRSNFSYEGSPRIGQVQILASIGIVILVIACINFINLTNVHSLKRAREIGVRKVLGAQKTGLLSQCLAQTGALVFVAFVLAAASLSFILPFVSTLSGKQLSIDMLFHGRTVVGLVVIATATTLLSGVYPALYVTRFQPVQVLRGLISSPKVGGLNLRKALMIIQFTVSIVLVVLSIVFWQQMEFIRSRSLGFQTRGVLTIPLFSDAPNSIFGGGVDGAMRGRMNTFEGEVLKDASIEGITLSSMLPGIGFSTNALVSTDKISEADDVLLPTIAVDYDFVQTYKLKVLAGRPFSRQAGSDHLQSFVINEKAVARLGWENPADAIGQHLSMVGKDGYVIGVVADFHFQGLQSAVTPLVMEVAAGKFTIFSVTLASPTISAVAIDKLQKIWNQSFPERVFEYRFLDQVLAGNYDNERNMSSIVQVFSITAIFISALGLFGLAAYINHQRAKEVGIRKVLGANARHVFLVLSSEFLWMAAIALAIAMPAAYYFAHEWLSSFAYRTPIGLVAFCAAAIIVFVTVVVTISYETVRSIRINPVSVLRE